VRGLTVRLIPVLKNKKFVTGKVSMPVTERLYYSDSHLIEFTAKVVDISERVSGWAAIVLDRTAFYPTGGGQPSDTGTLNGSRVVECIDDGTLMKIANNQSDAVRGTVIKVPVLEASGAMRVGRFGWKNQHASLLSFSADAYLNEAGITSPMLPKENTSSGQSVATYDQVDDPEDDGMDVQAFAEFMRATKAPPRDSARSATPDAQAGSFLFDQIRCSSCHTRTIVTATAGTVINGGTFTVPPALGGKTIHPFSDFLLHDVGTGDGVVQNGGSGTRNQLRTPPLWGVRTRNRLMHDGDSLTFTDAIQRHGGQASGSRALFNALNNASKDRVIAFLLSL